MIRPIEIVNTALLAAITLLLAMQLLDGTPTLTQAPPASETVLDVPTIACETRAGLFEEGESATCIPVVTLDAALP